jgi:hypothetical protein
MRLTAPVFVLLAASGVVWAQEAAGNSPAGVAACADPKLWTPCDLVFELTAEEAARHPEPWRSVELKAEVKSPRFRTFLAESFWDGGRILKIRFTPTDAGNWQLRLTSNFPRWDKQEFSLDVAQNEAPGFVQRANVYHWRTLGDMQPHLWAGQDLWDWTQAGGESTAALKAARATHVRTLLRPQWPPDPAHFQKFEEAVRGWNEAGMVVDVVLADKDNDFTKTLPNWDTRERYLRYLLSRVAPYNVTWELVREWETYSAPRTLLKDMAGVIAKYDPYNHPRSAHTTSSTSAFTRDGWMTHILAAAGEPSVIQVEHEMYPLPIVAVGPAGTPRKVLEAVFAGAYPGSGAHEAAAVMLESTRYWDLTPYFDVSNGRALALPGTEYIVLVDRPGIVEVETEKHGYRISWINADTGERQTEKKEYKGTNFVGETPAKSGNWILHLEREGRKEGMRKSYKFESRRILMQEPEVDPKRVPFTINIDDNTQVKAGEPVPFEITITRDTRATRFMQYRIAAEVATEFEGQRILATSAKGTLTAPAAMATKFPAVLSLRVSAVNANGKLYYLDRVLRLVK